MEELFTLIVVSWGSTIVDAIVTHYRFREKNR